MLLKRRDALLTALFGTGGIGLRALATGLPAWFIANPRLATAQALDCAIMAKEKLQYLILSTSSAGDPMNCNVPGTYEAAPIIHPTQVTMAATTVTLGGKTLRRALPWADTQWAARSRADAGSHGVLPPHDADDGARRSAQGDEAAWGADRR